MSLQLSLTAFLLISTLFCQGQKDSVPQKVTQTQTQFEKKADEITVKYKTHSDTLIKGINHVTSKYDLKADSAISIIKEIPSKYVKQVEKKIDKYSNQLTCKTEKTLTRLSRWENKIHTLLLKASPETAAKLFAPDQLTFTSLLRKIKDGQAIVTESTNRYDEYRDKLTTTLNYIQTQKDQLNPKYVKSVSEASEKISNLEEDLANTEAVEKFIKERKKQLVDEAVKYIGKSKYLAKINKESYYYIETLRNYKEIFSDPKRTEKIALNILNKIPAFKNFVEKNSLIASLFGNNSNYSSVESLVGLQTRANVNGMIQNKITSGGPNAKDAFNQSMQAAQAVLGKLKDKVMKLGNGSGNEDIPGFKPNTQKTKTFFQRLEYGTNIQFAKVNNNIPATADIGLSVGYKVNDKSIIGIGASYRMGLGTIQHINITNQGISLRSFIDWKIKWQFFMSGGFEMNHNSNFKSLRELQTVDTWQQSGLIGLTKKIKIKTKLTKETKVQLLYDILCRSHIPISQPFVFRVGYNFK